MDRQTEALRIAEELLADVELGRLETHEILLKSSRLSRYTDDQRFAAFIKFELYGYDSSESADRWMAATNRKRRNGEEPNGNHASLANVQAIRASLKSALDATAGTSVSGEYAVVAQGKHLSYQSKLTAQIMEYDSILASVRTRLYDFASRTYFSLAFSELQSTVFERAREQVDGLLASSAGQALEKIESIDERLRRGEPEAISQALNTCRRLIDETADSVFPARDGKFYIGEQSMDVKKSNVKNRLAAYVSSHTLSSSRRARIRRTVDDIYSRASAGVHDDVTFDEAKFIFLNTYLCLGEILTLRSDDGSAEGTGTPSVRKEETG